MGKASREKKEKRLQEDQPQEKVLSSSNNPLEKIYLAIIEIGVYIALFSPFIVNENYFFPYVSPKTIFFRIVVDVLSIIYVLLAISNRRYWPKFRILTVTLALFLLVSFITSITGINFGKSFMSAFERMT
ncbi:MAG: hypothetical protein Q7S70_00470, partial [bacterium]|nr:hypothetical protein [bacterium]